MFMISIISHAKQSQTPRLGSMASSVSSTPGSPPLWPWRLFAQHRYRITQYQSPALSVIDLCFWKMSERLEKALLSAAGIFGLIGKWRYLEQMFLFLNTRDEGKRWVKCRTPGRVLCKVKSPVFI